MSDSDFDFELSPNWKPSGISKNEFDFSDSEPETTGSTLNLLNLDFTSTQSFFELTPMNSPRTFRPTDDLIILPSLVEDSQTALFGSYDEPVVVPNDEEEEEEEDEVEEEDEEEEDEEEEDEEDEEEDDEEEEDDKNDVGVRGTEFCPIQVALAIKAQQKYKRKNMTEQNFLEKFRFQLNFKEKSLFCDIAKRKLKDILVILAWYLHSRKQLTPLNFMLLIENYRKQAKNFVSDFDVAFNLKKLCMFTRDYSFNVFVFFNGGILYKLPRPSHFLKLLTHVRFSQDFLRYCSFDVNKLVVKYNDELKALWR